MTNFGFDVQIEYIDENGKRNKIFYRNISEIFYDDNQVHFESRYHAEMISHNTKDIINFYVCSTINFGDSIKQ